MIKLVTNIYSGVLKKHIDDVLEAAIALSTEMYLEKLSALYLATTKLSNNLQEKLKLGGDTSFLVKLTKINLFSKYLETYIR